MLFHKNTSVFHYSADLLIIAPSWDKTAGTIVIEKNYIELQLKDKTEVLYKVDNIIPFKRK